MPTNECRAVEVAAAATDITITADARPILHGWSLSATAATVVYIRRGSATGPIVGVFRTTGAGADTRSLDPGVACDGGIYLDRDGTNSVEGAIYVR